MPTSKPRSHKRRCRRGKPAHREEEDQADNRPVKFQTSQTNNGKATSLGGRQSVLPRRISTPSQSEIKSVSNNRYCSSTSRTATSSQSENSVFCQNVSTTSHRMMRIHTTSTLRAISSAPRLTDHNQSPHPPGASRVKGAPYFSQTWLNQDQQCRGPS